MYSASVDESAMELCFLLDQMIGPYTSMNIYPRLFVCAITYPITISKPNQIMISFSFVEDPMSSCSLNKVKDPFGCSPMDLMRLIHAY